MRHAHVRQEEHEAVVERRNVLGIPPGVALGAAGAKVEAQLAELRRLAKDFFREVKCLRIFGKLS